MFQEVQDFRAEQAGLAELVAPKLKPAQPNRAAKPGVQVLFVLDLVGFLDRGEGDVLKNVLGELGVAHRDPRIADEPRAVPDQYSHDGVLRYGHRDSLPIKLHEQRELLHGVM